MFRTVFNGDCPKIDGKIFSWYTLKHRNKFVTIIVLSVPNYYKII